MTGSAATCCACKLQRRKCGPNCILAPYFPPSRAKDFENVHRLFGVGKITKAILQLGTKAERDEAMESFINEAGFRSMLPVHGSTGIIIHLYKQLELLTEELHTVNNQIQACRDLLGEQNEDGSGQSVFGSTDGGVELDQHSRYNE